MRALTTLAGTLLMLSTTCNAFMMLLEMPMPRTTHPLRSEELSASTKLGSEIEEGDSPSLGLLSRRSLLATTGLTVIGSVWKAQTSASQTTTKTNVVGLSSTTTTTSSSTFDLDQVMHILESSVDKRFLHAVVASDYQSLYMKQPEAISSSITQQQRRRRGRLSPSVLVVTQSTLLAAATTRTTTSSSDFLRGLPDSVQESLKVQLEGRRRIPRIQVDKSILVHSHWETAARMWGKENIVSVWPLDLSSKGEDANRKTVHYAWPAQEGDFLAAIQPPQQKPQQQQTSTHQDDMIIVDGINCGRMSLEDALQGDRQILVQAEQFLLIPQSMEQALRERLQGAFLI